MNRRLLIALPLLFLPLAAAAIEVPSEVDLDGVPDVPDELVERLHPYLQVRSASLAGLSPDGQSVWVRTRFDETSQLHHVEHPMGARQQKTFRMEPVGSTTTLGDDVIYAGDAGGNEQYQLFALRDGREVQLTEGDARRSGALPGPEGLLAYSDNARNGTDTDVRVGRMVDGALEPIALVTEMEGAWYAEDFSEDGSQLLVGRYISASESQIWLADLVTGELEQISPTREPAAYNSAVFGSSDRSLYVRSDRDGQFVDVYRVALGDKRRQDTWTLVGPRALDGDAFGWDVESASISADRSTLALGVNEEGYSALWLVDVASGELRQVELPPMAVVRGLTWAQDASVLGMTLTGPDRAWDAWTLDAASGDTLTQWTASELGGLEPDDFVVPELVRVESFDGLSVPAYVYRPEGEGPFPVVMRIHGGPEAQARPYFSGTLQYMVQEAGIAVVVPNVRGSRGYGRDYLALDNGVLREDSVRDVGAVLDFIADDPGLDAERVGVSGGSYGGYMVLASLVHYGDRIRAGCDVVGISSFVTFLENTKPYRQDLRRVEYGDERDPAMRAHLETISPLNHADKIQSALFVAHGANDPRVPVGEAVQIVEAVRASGNDAWLMVANNEGHGFRKKSNRDLYSALNVHFFEEQLLAD